ncbi:methyltransferase [Stenotrophomonas rhizophila]|nr:methyltransferase [Stenotrophomonas rhizophila]MCX2918661.1 methyltransferase [Stenotrophomonas rhizophila]
MLAAPAMAIKPAGPNAQVAITPAVQKAVQDSRRDPANVKRDAYRHPAQTLSFFGVAPGQTVIEITPGNGWYSEILAPLLHDKGQYVAAVVDPAAVPEGRGRDYQQRSREGLEKKFAADASVFGKSRVVAYDPKAPVFGPANSADVVLTFRNVHNWRSSGQAEGMFKGFFSVLKPGGVLGVVEHRAKADVPADDKTGYVGQQQVIAMAKAAGFELAGSSEINTNPRDTKDYPNGVWTLPPTNQHDAADEAKYQAIGESDRMTLRFVKPGK